jgi:hypothetical protein
VFVFVNRGDDYWTKVDTDLEDLRAQASDSDDPVAWLDS